MTSLFYSAAPAVFSAVREAVLSPVVSGSLLGLAIYLGDDQNGQSQIAENFPGLQSLATLINLTVAKSVLKALLGLSILVHVNRFLNSLAHNSWRLTASKGWDWPKEIAVVTGGSGGIGMHIVRKLAALGVRVAVLDVVPLPKEAEYISGVRFYHCDVTSKESISKAGAAIRKDFGHPTILVNNAGVARPAPILKATEANLHLTFGVNCISMWLTSQEFLPRMIELNKGHIVTVASIASFVALPVEATYSATKAGALAFHEALTSEIKHFYKANNIVTSVFHPNFVRTPMLASVMDGLERMGVRMLESEAVGGQIVDQIISKRGGQFIIPDHVSMIRTIRGWPTWMQESLRDVLGRGTAANAAIATK